jgi:hypothetical protein
MPIRDTYHSKARTRKARKANRKLRQRGFELLESRTLLSSDWHNSIRPADVDASGVVQPIDALLVINQLSRNNRAGLGTQLPATQQTPKRLFDVSASGTLEPLDALRVINVLAKRENPPQIMNLALTDPKGTGTAEPLTNRARFAGRIFDSNNPIRDAEIQIGSGTFQPLTFADDGTFTIELTSVADGTVSVGIRATDVSSQMSAIQRLAFTLDASPPVTSLIIDPANRNQVEIDFTEPLNVSAFAPGQFVVTALDGPAAMVQQLLASFQPWHSSVPRGH